MRLKIKHLLPIAPVTLAVVTATAAVHLVSGSTHQSVKADVGASNNAAAAEVKVNGQNVPLNNGFAEVTTPEGGVASINMSGDTSNNPSQTSEWQNADGSISVSVTSNSQNQANGTSIHISGGSTERFSNRNGVSVHMSGEGNIQVTK